MLKIEELLSKLKNVTPLKTGWKASCPAHDDKEPSLYVTPGTNLIMVHCFAACTFEDICRAIHVNPIDMFFDEEFTRHPKWIDKARLKRRLDAQREAERVIAAATHLDIERMPIEQVDGYMDWVCDARIILLEETWDKLQVIRHEEQILEKLMVKESEAAFPGSLE